MIKYKKRDMSVAKIRRDIVRRINYYKNMQELSKTLVDGDMLYSYTRGVIDALKHLKTDIEHYNIDNRDIF